MLKTIRELGVKVGLFFDKNKVHEANQAIATMAEGMKGVGVAVAGSMTALLGFAGVASHNARSLDANSQALGMNVERLQELQYAAKIAADVGREELNSALQGISATLFEGRDNVANANKTFIQLGVTLDDFAQSSPDQVLAKLADRFKEMPPSVYKTALAMKAGGESLVKLLPLLNMGSEGMAKMGQEGRSLGLIMNEKLIKEGAAFDKEWSKVWLVLKNISYLIGNQLIKYLKPFILEFEKFVVVNKKLIATGIAAVIKSLGTYLEIVLKVVRFLAERFGYLITMMGGVERVSKLIAIALGIFTGVKIISAVGTLITSFRALASVIGILESPALLIGAAFAALFLIVQDMMSDDSTIKKWFGEFKNSFPQMAGLAEDFIGVMVEGATMIKDGWVLIWEGIKPLRDWLSSGVIGEGFAKVEKFVGYLRSGDLGSKVYDLFHPGEASPTGGTSSPKGGGPGGGGDSSSKTDMTANVYLTIPHGANASHIADAAKEGTQKGFNDVLRKTRNQSLGGVAY